MEYKITEKQLQSINALIKILNIAIKRNAFTEIEVDKIMEKINLSN